MKLSIIILLVFFVSCSTVNNLVSQMDIKNPKQGKLVLRNAWTKNHDPSYDSGNLPVNLSSPLLRSGILFSSTGDGEMIAYDAPTGRILWKTEDKGASHARPILFKDQVIYGTNLGRLYSRHYLTGKLKYAVDLGASIESEVSVHKGTAVVHLRNYQITSFDVETGKILWAYKRSIPHLTTLQRVSRPVLYKGKIYVGFADGYLVCLALEDGVLQWEKRLSSSTRFVDVDNTPLIKNGKIYINSLAGPVYILNLQTGAILRQTEFTASRAPMIWESKLLFGTVDGQIVLTNQNLKIVKQKSLSDGGISSIKLWKKKLVVTTVRGSIYILNPKTFEVIEKKHLGHVNSAIMGEVAISDELLAIYSSRYRLYVFR